MKSTNEKLQKFFSDDFYIPDVEEMLSRDEIDSYTKDLIYEIIGGVSPAILFANLFATSKKEGFKMNIPLSDCFFMLSELTNISDLQRDFALNMSTHLALDSDSIDPLFNAEYEYSHIKEN